MINLYDEVKIISNGATGTVIDIDSKGMLTVEGHKGATTKDSVYGDDYPLYYVATTDVEKTESGNSGYQVSKKLAML